MHISIPLACIFKVNCIVQYNTQRCMNGEADSPHFVSIYYALGVERVKTCEVQLVIKKLSCLILIIHYALQWILSCSTPEKSNSASLCCCWWIYSIG